MANLQITGTHPAEAFDNVVGAAQRITVNDSWMPRSGYGPYCTIPISSSSDCATLGKCGLPSFPSVRREVRLLTEDYAAWAIALVAKARKERLALSRDVRGTDGETLIRPYRVRLCLHLDQPNGYLYLCWRGVVKHRGRVTRVRARMWDCQAELAPLIADAHPAEELLIRRIEAEAADIRRRWFALVRMVYYMNVAEEHRLADFEAGKIRAGGASGIANSVMRRLRGAFRYRTPLS